MRMLDIIGKKRDMKALTNEEICFAVEGYTQGKIPDYQMSALLMAIFLNGFDKDETVSLTMAMANSGEKLDLSSVPGIKVDKHSTGGVGDKTTLIVGPIVAALGVPVAKMSGRGLGHTGGTTDKLESICGYKTGLDTDEFIEQVKKIGIALVGQTGNLAPADKKIYALRDVTGTVESNALIAASIMSKKIAAGADAILLDVKFGSGAFMKTREEAQVLADTMVEIGELVGRKTIAILSDMNVPLGRTIGNSLEVIEAIEVLRGNGEPKLTKLCIELSANMLHLANRGNVPECSTLAKRAIADGSALAKFSELVAAQGGDSSMIDDTKKFVLAPIKVNFVSNKSGKIVSIDTQKCGMAACILGAGREKKEDSIDFGAGIVLHKALGDSVNVGESIAVLYTSDAAKIDAAEALLEESFVIE